MTTSKHTPGPWTVGETIIGSRNERIPEGLTVLFRVDGIAVYARHGTLGADPAADARLAAAAPELLEALRALVRDIDTSDDGRPFVETVDRARAALAKAGA